MVARTGTLIDGRLVRGKSRQVDLLVCNNEVRVKRDKSLLFWSSPAIPLMQTSLFTGIAALRPLPRFHRPWCDIHLDTSIHVFIF